MLAKDEILQARYRIIRQLGQGGMGAVYEAKDERLGSLVALKEILCELNNLPNIQQQELVRHAFEREAKILANLHHEAFPRVIDYFFEKDRQFLVMELMLGDDLHDLLEKRGSPFPLADVLHWAEQLLDALDYLHTQRQPIFHRDIKPHNLKLTDRGKIILLDFGIAKGADNHTQTSITHQTFVAVTMNYSPIEQIFRVLDSTFRNVIESGHGERVNNVSEQTVDGRSDLYSLGATLYHLVTGQLPVDALKRTLENWAGNSDILPNPSEVNPDIPPEISAFLLKAMEIERENRYTSANEMHQALRQAVANVNRREEEAKQAVFLAEQAQLAKQREIEEQNRLQMQEAEKRHTAERLHQAEIQRQLAEERAKEAERRLLERESQQDLNSRQFLPQSPTVKLPQVDLSLETTLHDYILPEKNTIQSPPVEKVESSPTENFEFSQTKNFVQKETDRNLVPNKTDSVVGITEASYLPEVLPENVNQKIGFKSNPVKEEKIEKPSPFKLKFFLLSAVVVFALLAIFGVATFVLIQLIPSTNSSTQHLDNKSLSTPTPIPTATPSVSPTPKLELSTTVQPTPSPLQPTPAPTQASPNETPDRSKPTPNRISTPTPRPTKTPTSKPPTPKPTKNPDCIFTDDCK